MVNLVASVMMNGVCCIHSMQEEEKRQHAQREALRKVINVEWQRQRLMELEDEESRLYGRMHTSTNNHHHDCGGSTGGSLGHDPIVEERRRLLMARKAMASSASASSQQSSVSSVASSRKHPHRRRHDAPPPLSSSLLHPRDATKRGARTKQSTNDRDRQETLQDMQSVARTKRLYRQLSVERSRSAPSSTAGQNDMWSAAAGIPILVGDKRLACGKYRKDVSSLLDDDDDDDDDDDENDDNGVDEARRGGIPSDVDEGFEEVRLA